MKKEPVKQIVNVQYEITYVPIKALCGCAWKTITREIAREVVPEAESLEILEQKQAPTVV